MAGADIRTRDISGRQHRAAPTTSPAVWYKTAEGLAPAREGHLIRPSGPPSPQGEGFCRALHASPNRGGVPAGGQRGLPPPGGGGGICEANDGRGGRTEAKRGGPPQSRCARRLPLRGRLFAAPVKPPLQDYRHTGKAANKKRPVTNDRPQGVDKVRRLENLFRSIWKYS